MRKSRDRRPKRPRNGVHSQGRNKRKKNVFAADWPEDLPRFTKQETLAMLRDWRKRRPPFELLDYSAHQIALAAGITYRRLNQILAGHQWPMGPIAHSRLSNVIDRVLRGELRFVGWNLAAGWIGGKTSAYDPRLERRWPY